MKLLSKIGLVLGLCLSAQAFSEGYEGSLFIDRVYIKDDRAHIGFTVMPADCLSSFASAHASLELDNTSIPLVKEILAILVTARITGKSIDIWYDDVGDCDLWGTVLQLKGAGFSAGQG